MALREILSHSVQQGAKTRAFMFMGDWNGALDELGLATVPVRWNDQPPRDGISGLVTEIAAHQMQAKIDPCSASRRREDVAIVDIEHVGLNGDVGIARPQGVGIPPMCRRTPSREKARRREDEDARADGHDPRAPDPRRRQRIDEWRRHGRFGAPPSGNDDRSGALDELKAAIASDFHAADAAKLSGFHRRHREPVPVRPHLGPRQAEDLHCDAELEGA